MKEKLAALALATGLASAADAGETPSSQNTKLAAIKVAELIETEDCRAITTNLRDNPRLRIEKFELNGIMQEVVVRRMTRKEINKLLVEKQKGPKYTIEEAEGEKKDELLPVQGYPAKRKIGTFLGTCVEDSTLGVIFPYTRKNGIEINNYGDFKRGIDPMAGINIEPTRLIPPKGNGGLGDLEEIVISGRTSEDSARFHSGINMQRIVHLMKVGIAKNDSDAQSAFIAALRQLPSDLAKNKTVYENLGETNVNKIIQFLLGQRDAEYILPEHRPKLNELISQVATELERPKK